MCTKEDEVANFLNQNYKKKDSVENGQIKYGLFSRDQKYYIKDKTSKNCVRAFQCKRTFKKGDINPTTGEVFAHNTCYGKLLDSEKEPDQTIFKNDDSKFPFLIDDDPKDAPFNEVWYRTCPFYGCPTKSVTAVGGTRKRKQKRKSRRFKK